MVDLVIDEGSVTLGVEPSTVLLRWVGWSLPHQNLGEPVLTTTFVGYQPGAMQLAMTWSSTIDWRNTLVQTRLLEGCYVNSDQTSSQSQAKDQSALRLRIPRPPVGLLIPEVPGMGSVARYREASNASLIRTTIELVS